jgi:hypothetical protein
VASHYPVRSIRDISLGGGLVATLSGGPWKAKVAKIQGIELSLDDIEHGILRPVFKDPRVHYAVNCASIGCPNLRTEAFTGAKLSQQLDSAAGDYVNSSRGVRFENGRGVVSSIYVWFEEDFGWHGSRRSRPFANIRSPEFEPAADVKSVGKTRLRLEPQRRDPMTSCQRGGQAMLRFVVAVLAMVAVLALGFDASAQSKKCKKGYYITKPLGSAWLGAAPIDRVERHRRCRCVGIAKGGS